MRQRNGGTKAAPGVLSPPHAAADENRDFLRGLLARKEPEFARALAAVERELEQQVRDRPQKRSTCGLCGRCLQRDRDFASCGARWSEPGPSRTS